jgi:hypothetical protein
MKLELNTNEAQVLLNLIDVAVKAVGLQAAESALHFKEKIEAASVVPAPSVMEDGSDDD